MGGMFTEQHICVLYTVKFRIWMSTYWVKLRLKVKCMMQTKCWVQGYLNKAQLFTSSIFSWLTLTVHLHTNFIKHIFNLGLLYKNHIEMQLRPFYNLEVESNFIWQFIIWLVFLSDLTICTNCLLYKNIYSKPLYMTNWGGCITVYVISKHDIIICDDFTGISIEKTITDKVTRWECSFVADLYLTKYLTNQGTSSQWSKNPVNPILQSIKQSYSLICNIARNGLIQPEILKQQLPQYNVWQNLWQ